MRGDRPHFQTVARKRHFPGLSYPLANQLQPWPVEIADASLWLVRHESGAVPTFTTSSSNVGYVPSGASSVRIHILICTAQNAHLTLTTCGASFFNSLTYKNSEYTFDVGGCIALPFLGTRFGYSIPVNIALSFTLSSSLSHVATLSSLIS